ncbi:MAG TPA: alpha/beta hydrolase [Bradyrhizobium sp.]|nr:alpha/beta hydrolase [Bradyrhizobium sp.]
MFVLSRRAMLAGSGAAVVNAAMPAVAQQTTMPAVRMVETNGIRLAVYEAGAGPAVVLLHGFPGLAFSWRNQIQALVDAGYRVIAPDLRGYGLSDAPQAVEAYDITQLTADLTGLLDKSGIERAVFMGHDWGGLLAWQMPLLHRKRVAGAIGINTPFIPHWMLWLHPDLVKAARPGEKSFIADPARDPIAQMRAVYSSKMYVLLFQDGHSADEAMERDPRGTLRNSMRKDLMTSAEWRRLPPEVANMEYYGQPIPPELPGKDVQTDAELDFFAERFKRTGFTPGINWYRNLTRNWASGLAVDQTIRVPSLMISGSEDVVLRPSMAEGMHAHVPDLERQVIENCWHWTPEEKPAELNRLVIAWLKRRFPA